MQYILCIVGMAKMTKKKVGQQWILDFRWIWKESAISKVEFSHALHFLLSSEYHRIVIFCWFNEKYVFSSHCLLLKCCSEPQVKVRSGIFPLQNSEIVPHPVTAVYNATKMIPSNDWTSRLIWPSQITGDASFIGAECHNSGGPQWHTWSWHVKYGSVGPHYAAISVSAHRNSVTCLPLQPEAILWGADEVLFRKFILSALEGSN